MRATFKPVRPLCVFLRVLIAPSIWFMHLVIVYAAEALICIGPLTARNTAMTWMVFLASAVALTGLVILAVENLHSGKTVPPTKNQGSAWFQRASLLLTLLSTLGVIWTVLPTVILPACASSSAQG